MSQPLINFEHYSVPGLLFNGAGCLFWVLSYAILVWEIRRKRFVEMPAYVACANIGWEFVWSFIYHPDSGMLYSFSYQAAFFLDCYIYYALMRYGTKQPILPTVKVYFRLLCLLNFLFWILFSYFYRREVYDTNIGANSGYIINVILSMQCLMMLLQSPDVSDFSMRFAVCKMLGTGLISVSMFIFYPDNQFVQLLGCACFLLDNTYIIALRQRQRYDLLHPQDNRYAKKTG